MTKRSPIRPLLLRWLPAVAWAAVIFIGSSIPGSAVPGRFGVLGHLTEYAILGALALRAEAHRGLRTSALITLVFVAIYGASDEVHQLFVPLRVADPLDWLTDLAGAILGILVVAAVRRARTRSNRGDV